jgi:hypothetical protein
MKNVSDYKAPIRGIAKLILKLLTQLATLFLDRIKDLEVRLMAQGMLESASKTVEVLSDADPEDRDQLKKIVNELFKDGPFKTGAREEILQQILTIDNENVKRALIVVNSEAFTVADMLTDEMDDNGEQLKTYLIRILESETGVELINALLSILLPAAYADTLTILIIQALLNWIEESERDDAAEITARLIDLQKTYEKKAAKTA